MHHSTGGPDKLGAPDYRYTPLSTNLSELVVDRTVVGRSVDG